MLSRLQNRNPAESNRTPKHARSPEQAGQSVFQTLLRPLLPFVKSVFSQSCRYVWQDEALIFCEIRQHDGGERRTFSCPSSSGGEELFAFLDDVYTVSSLCGRQCNLVGEKLWSLAGDVGIRMKGVLPTWSIWVLRSGAHREQGVGNANRVFRFEFIKEVGGRELEEERLWDVIPWIPNLQCAWQVVLQCDGSVLGTISHGAEDVGDFADENGRVGLPICRKDGALCILMLCR